MKLHFLALVLAIPVASAAFGQEIHSEHCLHGCPLGGKPTDDLVIRDIYILRSNNMTKLADWVAYRVTQDTIGRSQRRNWRADPLLQDHERLEPDDYRGANAALRVDRGHQAPLASFSGTEYWPETNYLSNITPQRSALNQGPWMRLERAVRTLAKTQDVDNVYVQTGPLFERPMPLLPNADKAHMVPSGYWKIVAIPEGETISVAAFVMEQETPRNADLCEYETTVVEIETRAQLRFFHHHRAEFSSLGSEFGC
ncbi:MAG: DNA/RNA non-specific endonuclease [Burkholderiales bacterium]